MEAAMNEDIHDQINDIVNSLSEDTAEESLESAFVAGRLSAAFYLGLTTDMEWDDERVIHLVASFATQAFVLLEESAVEEGGD